jgi:hypothetical protein
MRLGPIEGKPLRDLLVEAIRYGERPDVRVKLTHLVSRAFDRSQLEDLLKESTLVHDAMDASRVNHICEDMERAEMRRLLSCEGHHDRPRSVLFPLAAVLQHAGKSTALVPGQYDS